MTQIEMIHEALYKQLVIRKLPRWEARRLAEKAVRPFCKGTGFHFRTEEATCSAEVEWDETVFQGQEKVVNRGTPFEFSAGRVWARPVRARLVARKPETGDGCGRRVYNHEVREAYNPCGPDTWVGPVRPNSWQEKRGIDPKWDLIVVEGEWQTAVMIDGDVDYDAPDPASVRHQVRVGEVATV